MAIAAHLDIGIPTDVAQFPIGRVVAPERERLQQRRLGCKPLGDNLMHRAVAALVRFLPHPLLRQLIEMRPTLEVAIADEEVVFDLAHHPFKGYSRYASTVRPRTTGRIGDG